MEWMSGSSISKLVPNDRNPNFCTIHLGAVSFSGTPPPYRRSRPVQEASLGPGHSFVDVGSGLGKLVVAAACVTPDEVPCYGVEISPFRWGAPDWLQTSQSDETNFPRWNTNIFGTSFRCHIFTSRFFEASDCTGRTSRSAIHGQHHPTRGASAGAIFWHCWNWSGIVLVTW